MSLLMFALLLAAPDEAADRTALTRAKIVDWPAFYRENDADGLAAFLADGFVHVEGDGAVETKATAVEWVRRNRWSNGQRGFRYDIGDIAFYGPDVANLWGAGSWDGATCRMTYRSTNIFVRRDGRWRPIFSQTGPARCAEPSP